MIICPKCNTGNPDDSFFCSECGNKLEISEKPSESAMPAEQKTEATVQNKKNNHSKGRFGIAGEFILERPVYEYKNQVQSL